MKTNLISWHQVTEVFCQKYLSNFKLILMLLFFMVPFAQNANAQACKEITIKGSASSVGDVISFEANLDYPGQAITWTILQANSAAFFTENGLTTVKKVSVAGSNAISINVGPNHGSFTVKLTFDASNPPNSGGCSSSYSF